MNSALATTAPISGLLSLVAGALEPAGTGAPASTPDLASVLGELAGGWMALKEDGQGWLVLQFAPHAAATDPAPAPVPESRPVPARPDFGARAQRVHTALTDREREVLCLVAGGAKNRQIAARLFISPKTASVHVSRILAKLGVGGRVEAAAVAHRLGLTEPAASV